MAHSTYPQKSVKLLTEWLGLEGTSSDHLLQPPTYSRLPRAVSNQFWILSKVFSYFQMEFPVCCSVCAHCLLFGHCMPLRRAWLCRLQSHLSGIYIHWSPKSPLSLPFSRLNSPSSLDLSSYEREVLRFFNHLCGPVKTGHPLLILSCTEIDPCT